MRTVVLAEDEGVDAAQAEDVEEVPRRRRDPRGVQRHQLDAALQHRLEAQRQRERHFGCDRQTKPINN